MFLQLRVGVGVAGSFKHCLVSQGRAGGSNLDRLLQRQRPECPGDVAAGIVPAIRASVI